MYLHVGNHQNIRIKDIIGIFDIENTSVSKYTKEFLRAKQQSGSVINVTYEMPKSFVVTVKDDREKVYLSQLAPVTLKKRGERF